MEPAARLVPCHRLTATLSQPSDQTNTARSSLARHCSSAQKQGTHRNGEEGGGVGYVTLSYEQGRELDKYRVGRRLDDTGEKTKHGVIHPSV